ncbi:MAG TPA: glycosyltransferase family 4 protein [Vicinamibacterales bacterium]|nr:glycosyltransferase family 4 protein [Vicinamibacterales bacterium]
MARIVVATSHPPFAEGGHLVVARALVTALNEYGHQAGLITTPQNRFGRQLSAYGATRLTDVGLTCDDRPVDQLISLRYPSYALRHRVHTPWLNHRMREYYDLWEQTIARLSTTARLKEQMRRRLIHAVDGRLLARVTRLYAQSQTIQARLAHSGLASEVIYPPAPHRPYACEGYGDCLFAVSRLTPHKRVDLLIRALAEPAACGVRCTIAGDGGELPNLRRLAAELGVDRRVEFLGRIDDAMLVRRLATCRAVCFTPYNEDYGLVTVEAFASRKAVITCTDSGGPTELVEHGVQGLVSDPNPPALARAIRALMEDRRRAEAMGDAAFRKGATISWPSTVERLVLV